MATKRIENLVKSVNNRLQPVLEFDRFYAALYNPIKSLVEFPCVTQDGQLIEWSSRPYQPTAWLPDSIIQSKAARLVEQDLKRELKDGGLEYWPGGDLPQSWLAVPMIVENRAIGAMVVENRRKSRAFGENDLRVLTSVARQTAQSIENARLLERLNALYKMSPELNSRIRLGESAILQLIYEQASELMDTSNLYVALYDAATDTVRFPLMYLDGQTTQVEPRSSGKGRTEWIIRNRQPIFIETRTESEAWYGAPGREEYIGEPLASWVGVPMMFGDKVLGVIATYHKTKDNVYTKDDQDVLELMASQAAVAVENARLYSNLEKQNEQLAALQEIGIEITSQLELEEVLGSIVEYANRLTNANFSTLFTYNQKQDRFEKAIRKGQVTIAPSIPSNSGSSARIAKTQEPVFVQDTEMDRTLKPAFLTRTNTRSFAGVPLVAKGGTVGVLFVNYIDVHSFSPDEQGAIQLLTNQAAVAIENATLFEENTRAFEEKTQALEEKAHAFELLRKQQSKTIAANRLAMANTIATEFVHRMNNIAGTTPVRIKQIKESLDQSGYVNPKIAHYFDAISRDVDGLLKAAKAIRASTATAEVELVDAAFLVSTAIQRVTPPVGIDILDRCETNLPKVLVPSTQLIDTLENLIRNGVEAIEQTGTVAISGRAVTLDDDVWIVLKVSDTGRGIPADQLARIGELFFTTKEGGMGFGLWRAKTLIESLGGKISVTSEVGSGTVFTIQLPKAKEV
jgi:GAF domain-containing protein